MHIPVPSRQRKSGQVLLRSDPLIALNVRMIKINDFGAFYSSQNRSIAIL
jgi:hypothetical protein